ncbi:electron transfer flavoprotein subunit alpha/FixB family protein [Candidatus Liberibacter brunswickensis]|uniref:electron transfer flavoprotein subunit alpha/FixB family protein n=1 Tax=Candidatus Liberibacter brunswickensis TaxID=1968796 RepID=UPI002FE255F5
MPALLLADYNLDDLSEQTARIVTAAHNISRDIHVLVIGNNVTKVAQQAAQIQGVTKVIVAQHNVFQHKLTNPISNLMISIAQDYRTIIASANAIGRDVLPRVAAMLDVMQISEVIEIITPKIFKRTLHSGNIIQTVETKDIRKVITIRTISFSPAPKTKKTACIQKISSGILEKYITNTRFINEDSSSKPINISSAKIIISGGKSFGSKENFHKLLIPLAKKIGAAVGATRDAVNAGFAPNNWQIGQTGVTVSPDLYIAAGISGAIQHTSGMKDSKVIISINTDENAPIFKISDYFIVGDIFKILPEIEKNM